MSTPSATGVGPSVTTPSPSDGPSEGAQATPGRTALGTRPPAPSAQGLTPAATATPDPQAVDLGAQATPPTEDGTIGPIWRPDPATLDLPPPTFAHNSGTFAAAEQDIRIMSVNTNGNMMSPPAPGLPTALQTILHGASVTDTDFIYLQDTRVTYAQAGYFEYLCWPWRVFQNPAPTTATGGCAILTRGHWATRDFTRALLPDGRGIHLEVKGQGQRYLALLNLYCWPASASESPTTRLDPTSAFRKNQDIFDTCVTLLAPALSRGRFLVLGGDLNMVLNAARDRAAGAPAGHLRVQEQLRDFCARLRVAPPPPGAGCYRRHAVARHSPRRHGQCHSAGLPHDP